MTAAHTGPVPADATADAVPPHPADALIAQLDDLMDAIRVAEFPALVAEEVEDDRETFLAVRCPRCGDLVESEDLRAVTPAFLWIAADDIESDETHARGAVSFYNDQTPDLEETLYYRHREHAVRLPEGWREDWQ
ncbi:hypothetical protein [Leifsonia shinshuensis]